MLHLLHPRVQVFLKLSEHKTLHEAAYRLGLTQPTLTRSIQLLEEELGAKLFERGRDGIQLTASGVAFKKKLEKISHAHSDELQTALLKPEELPVRIGLSEMIGSQHLYHHLNAIQKESPPLQIHSNRSNPLYLAVEKGELHFALLSWVGKPKTLDSIQLYKDKMAIVGLKSRFKHIEDARSFKDLENEVWCHEPDPERSWMDSLEKNRPCYVVGGIATPDLVLAGLGIAEIQLDSFYESDIKKLAIAPVRPRVHDVYGYAVFGKLNSQQKEVLDKMVEIVKRSSAESPIQKTKLGW